MSQAGEAHLERLPIFVITPFITLSPFSPHPLMASDLVTSIEVPALDPAAADVFFRVNNRTGNIRPVYIDDLLSRLDKLPLLLLWGDSDPWVVPARVSPYRG